jgi:hypothetical protein
MDCYEKEAKTSKFASLCFDWLNSVVPSRKVREQLGSLIL